MKQTLFTAAACLRRQTTLLLFLFLGLAVVSCSPDDVWDELEDVLDGLDKADKIPEHITFTSPGLYPEGVDHDALHQRFLVSSLSQGTIGQVSYKGSYTPFIEDDRLVSTIGLRVDEMRGRVLVAGSDPGGTPNSSPETAGQQALLGIYDLKSGEPLHLVDLGALRPGMPHFANDIALDERGNAYVTDSFSPIIYKVNPQGEAAVFFQNKAFATAPGEFGFNGIAYHPDGFLLVAYSATNEIYRIPVRDPSVIGKVELDTTLNGPDGLLLSQNGRQLVVVNNAGGQEAGRVLSFTTTNTWETGTLKDSFATGAVFPTTATGYGNEVFVLYAYLNRLFEGANPPQSEFTIRKVPFAGNQYFGK